MTACKTKCGAKKSNGHKMDCGCPICKNMSKSKKRGGDKDDNEELDRDIVDDGKETRYG